MPSKPAPKTNPLRRILPLLVLAGVAAYGANYYWHSLHYEETDDAQVDANLTAMGSRITGTVRSVAVIDNQVVHKGDVLVELDPSDYQVLVEQARARVALSEAQLNAEAPNVAITEVSTKSLVSTSASDVVVAQASIAASQREVAQEKAQLTQAEASAKLAHTELTRAQQLLSSGSISQDEFDRQKSAADVADASLDALKAAILAGEQRVNEGLARANAAGSRLNEARVNAPKTLQEREALVELQKANLALAKSQLAQAELNLSYTKIVSPVDGIVGRVAVHIGDFVQPGQQFFSITQTGEVWVTANFRETQLKKMRVGQSVEVSIDAFDRTFHGTLESFAGATGSRYSLLPPENATGNFVEVVQRLPVRIHLDPGQSGLDLLRLGMSAVPEVKLQ